MNYIISKSDELYHYGVKGMKWGIRKDPARVGGLTEKEYSKYYTKGKLNRKGRKAKQNAQSVSNFHKAHPVVKGLTVGSIGASAYYSAMAANLTSAIIHRWGNVTITRMHLNGASFNKRKAVAAAHIAAMGTVYVSAALPYAKFAYRNTRYKLDKNYAKRTDTIGTLSDSEKRQRKKV